MVNTAKLNGIQYASCGGQYFRCHTTVNGDRKFPHGFIFIAFITYILCLIRERKKLLFDIRVVAQITQHKIAVRERNDDNFLCVLLFSLVQPGTPREA